MSDFAPCVEQSLERVDRWIADRYFDPGFEWLFVNLDLKCELWNFVDALKGRLRALQEVTGLDPMESEEGRALEFLIADVYHFSGNPGPRIQFHEQDYLDYVGSVAPLVDLLLRASLPHEALLYIDHATEKGAELEDVLELMRQQVVQQLESKRVDSSFRLSPPLRLEMAAEGLR